MTVNVSLKAPEEGEWVALTEVDADGNVRPLGYVNAQDLLRLASALQILHQPLEILAEEYA